MPKNKSWFRMSKKDDNAEIEIFDEIDSLFGLGLTEFKARYDEVRDAKNIRVLLNSIGGDVFVGMAIYNLMAKDRERIDIETVGIAASISSIIALAGRSHTIDKGAFFMIHNPISIMAGGSADFRKRADLLDTMHGQFVSIYAEKSGLGEKEIGGMMDSETWLTAEEAVDKGFADSVGNEIQMAAKATPDTIARYGFNHVPETLARASNENKITNPRDFEGALRDLGFTKKEAVAIVADGWKAVGRSDSEPAPRSDSVGQPLITPAMLIEEIEAQETVGKID